MPTNYLYNTWFQRLQDLCPDQRITQTLNFVWLIIGIFQSRSVCLSRIAGKVPGTAKLLSITRRFSRLLANPAIRVWAWYEPIAREWLERQFRHAGEIRLIVDGTKIGFGHQLLIPTEAAVFLVGDCEFGAVAVLRQLDQWRWFYVLRQKSDSGVFLNPQQGWQPFGSFIQRPGQSFWLGRGELTVKEIYPTNLLVYWEIGEKEL